MYHVESVMIDRMLTVCIQYKHVGDNPYWNWIQHVKNYKN